MKPYAILLRLLGVLVCLSSPCADADSPQETYEQYLATVIKATRLRDVFPYLTRERIETIEFGLKKAADQGVDPVQVENFTLGLLKTGAKDKARFRELVIEEDASVVVERKDVTVEVLMVLVDGSWKIADERMVRIPNFD
ncbi:MAG: hypothetical protein ACR2RB_18310 [Gammaproteobacteria bacterium]